VKPRSGVDLAPVVAEVIGTMSTTERQVEERGGRLHVMRVRPSRITGNDAGDLPALLLVIEDRTGAERDDGSPSGLRPARRTGPA
jgi:hypothetical protein